MIWYAYADYIHRVPWGGGIFGNKKTLTVPTSHRNDPFCDALVNFRSIGRFRETMIMLGWSCRTWAGAGACCCCSASPSIGIHTRWHTRLCWNEWGNVRNYDHVRLVLPYLGRRWRRLLLLLLGPPLHRYVFFITYKTMLKWVRECTKLWSC